jgi:hypothetical protein
VFLGEQEEHHAHHHRDRTTVDVVRVDVGQTALTAFPRGDVGPADRRDQQLDGLADLHTEGLGELLLEAEAGP